MKLTKINESKKSARKIGLKEAAEHESNMRKLKSIYRKYAKLDEKTKVTEENLNCSALSRVAETYACNEDVLKEALLQEAAEQEVTTLNDIKNEEEVGELWEALDDCLKQAKKSYGKRLNLMVIGRAGFGKSEIVEQWCDANGLNLYKVDTPNKDREFFTGIPARDADDPRKATVLKMSTFEKNVTTPNTVVFFDEYNRAKDSIRGLLHNLLTDFAIEDADAPGGLRSIKDTVLFFVLAQNPSGAIYRGAKPVEPSEITRARTIEIHPNAAQHLAYLTKYYNSIINNPNLPSEEILENKGKLALATKLLSDPDFEYSSEEDEEEYYDEMQRGRWKPLNYRSLHQALEASDGKKAKLIKVWNQFCAVDKKGMIENILSDYVDIADKANDLVVDGETDSDVFSKRSSNSSRLKDLYGNKIKI